MTYLDAKALARFEAKWIPEPNSGCWLWTSEIEDGYGRFWHGKNERAYITSFKHYKGRYKKGLDIDHKCRVRSCVNPDHLEPVTRRTNTLRGVGPTARNAKAIACINGHPFDKKNTRVYKGYRVCRACELERGRVKQGYYDVRKKR